MSRTMTTNTSPLNVHPETPAQIAAYLRDLSQRMLTCGTAMDYYGGFGGCMAAHGLEMIGAARIAAEWAAEIEAGRQTVGYDAAEHGAECYDENCPGCLPGGSKP